MTQNPERINSVGRAGSPFLEVAVVDEDGTRLPAGEVGEIVVRSAMSLGAYWGMPDKTSKAFFPGDWFRPFDVGYLDRDGFLYYADRAGDKIVTARGVVYPHLVEAAIVRHAATANCGVVGLGAEGSQAVVAAVQLKEGIAASPELEAEILADTAEGLAEHERPSRLVFLPSLPTVLGGAKVQRQALREQLQGQLAIGRVPV
ncbi:MAG: AMP-binding protein [Chloroflexi bacterium]|nr:AMP-binding protein [Chloroflexota bacterium]